MFWRIIPNMTRIPRFRLLFPRLGIFTPLLRVLSQGIQFAVLRRDLSPKRSNLRNLLLGKRGILAILLRLFLPFVELV